MFVGTVRYRWGVPIVAMMSIFFAENTMANTSYSSIEHCSRPIKKYKQLYKPTCFCYPRRPDAFAYNIGRDVVSLLAHIWDWDTFKILVGFFPAFIASRMIDNGVQDNFFCHGCHRNVNQLPGWCHTLAQWGFSVPIVALGSLVVFSKNYEFRQTGWMLWIGLPFLIWGKKIIKVFDTNYFDADCCLRPWHQDFCGAAHQRHPGGLPSGHMAEAVYLAVLYGSRFGPAFGVPLGALAVGVGAVFLNCNRHYLSQLIAGVALGTIFAVAANKVIDHRMAERVSIGFGQDSQGSPGFNVSWKF